MDKAILNHIKSFEADLIEIRRDLHQHPETAFNEKRTSDVVARLLKKLGLDVYQGIANTGVVGSLTGKRPGSRTIGFRADMDALPIQESTSLDYASTNNGVMHACGHDGHTAILLGAARYLAENRNFCGTIRFIFQPAEEGLGGAKAMIDEGLFEKFPCNAVYAMHAVPGLETGQFAIRPGPFLASSDTWSVVFKGTGGHGAIRHKAIDPFLPAGAFISALQSVVSANVPSEEPAVLSIGHINGGEYDAPNVIPDQITLRGTARCFRPDIRDLLENQITHLAKSTAAVFSCDADVEYIRRYPPLINSTKQTRIAIQAAVNVAGSGNVDPNTPRVSGADDFAYMLEKVPGAYINLGCGDGPFVHTPHYDFNDAVIATGAAYWANLAAIELSEP